MCLLCRMACDWSQSHTIRHNKHNKRSCTSFQFLCVDWKTAFEDKLLIFQHQLCHVLRNILRRCEAFLDSGGWYFETLQELS